MKKMLLSLFIISSLPVFGQTAGYKWHKVNCPVQQRVVFLEGTSGNDYWIGTVAGRLLHFDRGKWEQYPVPMKENSIAFTYLTAGEEILCAANFKDQTAGFFIFKNGKWEMSDLHLEIPAKRFFKTSTGKVFCYCDWGTLVEYSNGNFRQIEYPYENHIFSAFEFSDKVYFGTRKDGLVEFDKGKYRRFTFSGYNQSDIYDMLGIDSVLYILLHNGIVVKLQNDSVTAAENFTAEKFKKSVAYKFGLQRLNKKPGAIFPSHFNPDIYRILQNGDILIVSEKGDIFSGKETNHEFFFDLSASLFVNGSYNIFYTGTGFTDINNDLYPDIFVIANEEIDYPLLLLNNPGSFFSDYTGPAGLLKVEKPIMNFDIADVDCDGLQDIIIENNDAKSSKLKLYNQSGDGKFTLSDSVCFPDIPFAQSITNWRFSDTDFDGYPDMVISSYFDTTLSRGYNFLMQNDKNGSFHELDSSVSEVSGGWNYQTIVADFNNDNFDDWYVVTLWTNNKLLLYNKNEKKFDYCRNQAPEIGSSFSGGAVDYDNDGDLDIFLITDFHVCRLLENDGNANFTEVTEQKKLGIYKSDFARNHSIKNLTFGDFNNDGFTDVFISIKEPETARNYLLLNEKGEYFKDFAEEFEVDSPYVFSAATADFDLDGDLDILGCGEGFLKLWSNSHDGNDYIEILLKGILSPADAFGSKIWIYKHSETGKEKKLIGFKQIGSDKPGFRTRSDFTAHFGLSTNTTYDVKVRFTSGKEIFMENVKPSQKLVISEITGISAFLYKFPGMLYRFLANIEIQLYFIFTILTALIGFITIKKGIALFQWDQKTTGIIITLNISLYWIIILLSVSSEIFFVKHLLAPSIVIAGIILPHFFSRRIRKHSEVLFNKEKAEDELLQKMIVFSHGQWALRNLNSLQLLLANSDAEMFKEEKFEKQLNERIETFYNLTMPEIKQIISLAGLTGSFDNVLFKLEELNNIISDNLKKITAGNFEAETKNKTVLALINIKNILSDLRKRIFNKFSCCAVDVIKDVSALFESSLIENNISIERIKETEFEPIVLIRSNELADIIHNCVSNSIRALSDQREKNIRIRVFRSTPKYNIEITDNGKGIEPELTEKIFEKGFSGEKGTGIGLKLSRELLSKYGGRIYLKESVPFEKTVFIIELNEGNFNETQIINN